MSLPAFEASMRGWRARLAAMSRNISDLGDVVDGAMYVGLKARMASRSKPDPSNMTDVQLHAWKESQEELWNCVRCVGEAVDRAEQSVKGAWAWQRDDVAAKAAMRLASEPVELPGADVSVLERTLLASAQDVRRLSLDDLLGTMDAAFERSKKCVVELVAALKGSSEAIDSVEARIKSLEDRGWAEIAEARPLLDKVRAIAVDDPVHALDIIAKNMTPVLVQAEAVFEAQAASRAGAASLTAQAGEKLRELIIREKAVSASRVEVEAKMPGMTRLAGADRAGIRELAAWFERLERMLKEAGPTSAWTIGMQNWLRLLGMHSDALVAEGADYERLLARRVELRTRFESLEVKRRTRINSGADGEGARLLAERVKPLLFGGATPLAEAEAVFKDYERAVSRMSVAPAN